MNYTTNYNLNKPEGTDLYNHLTVDNPNMDAIDAAMYANKLQAIGNATELVSGTVHALTRSDGDQNIFRFKSTGDFHLGDTITVDGVSVNAYTTAGQPLLEEAYVLSAEVICLLDATNLWVLVNKVPDASEIAFDNTGTTLSSNNAEGAIKELNSAANIDYNGISVAQTLNKLATSNLGSVTTLDTLNNIPANTPCIGYLQNGIHPFFGGAWCTIDTKGSSDNLIKNQTCVSAAGIAFRHFESGNWTGWTKVTFS